MRKLLLAAVASACLCSPAYAKDPGCQPNAKNCVCTQTTDPRTALGYNPLSQLDGGRQTISAPWVCIDRDALDDSKEGREAVTYHIGGANIASDPAITVKMVSPGGLTYSADFTPPQ